jgi:hypothetical protein
VNCTSINKSVTDQTNWRTNMRTLLLSLTIASMLTACAAGLDPAPEADTQVSSSADEGAEATTEAALTEPQVLQAWFLDSPESGAVTELLGVVDPMLSEITEAANRGDFVGVVQACLTAWIEVQGIRDDFIVGMVELVGDFLSAGVSAEIATQFGVWFDALNAFTDRCSDGDIGDLTISLLSSFTAETESLTAMLEKSAP